jgi:hypothetical protein
VNEPSSPTSASRPAAILARRSIEEPTPKLAHAGGILAMAKATRTPDVEDKLGHPRSEALGREIEPRFLDQREDAGVSCGQYLAC